MEDCSKTQQFHAQKCFRIALKTRKSYFQARKCCVWEQSPICFMKFSEPVIAKTGIMTVREKTQARGKIITNPEV